MCSIRTCLLLILFMESVPLLAQNMVLGCRIAPGLESQLQGNAGCVIRIDNKMLIVRHQKTGKLSPPAGTAKKGETAQCTAHRETREETGVEVTVGKLLKEFDSQFYLFHCTVVNQAVIRIPEDRLAVPSDRTDEIDEVFFIDPLVLSNDSWRFPEQLPDIRVAFQSIVDQNRED